MKLFKTMLLAGLLLAAPALFAQTANLTATILPSAVRTTTVPSADQTNCCWKGGHFIVNVSQYTAGTYTLTVQGKDPVGGGYYNLLASATFGTPTGLTILKIYPGLPVTTNVSANDVLPRTWRVLLTGSSANMTLSVGAVLEP